MNNDMYNLTSINSVIMVRLITGKPKLSATLETTHKQIAFAKGADKDFVRAPSAKLFKSPAATRPEPRNCWVCMPTP
jgi:hypothetical protein